jgi:hypothetical protein
MAHRCISRIRFEFGKTELNCTVARMTATHKWDLIVFQDANQLSLVDAGVLAIAVRGDVTT